MVNFARGALISYLRAGPGHLDNCALLTKQGFCHRFHSIRFLRMPESDLLKPPSTVSGMTQLDKKCFDKLITVPCLSFHQVQVSKVLKHVKQYLLKIDQFKPIQHEESKTVFYLNPTIIRDWTDFPIETRECLETLSINNNNFEEKEVALKYENFAADDILKAVLPSDKEGCSSYTKTGHIVHVNLREHLVPYKTLIGEVLHDKVSGCRSVVNKLNSIDNTYRNFKMEVLYGETDTIVRLKENKCVFEFDFSTVYWNSRLSTEHERIVNMLKPNDVLFDIFAGVGPFSVPAAKNKCIVFANDLNPESYKWLDFNKKLNKTSDTFLKIFNKDGRDFILQDMKELLPNYIGKHTIYVTMNLPALAVDFLNAFIGLLRENEEVVQNPPVLFVYCFAKGEDYLNITKQKVIDGFGFDVSKYIIDMCRVRTVSSLKEMMRVQIKLDSDILTGRCLTKRKLDEADLPSPKKCHHGEKQEEDQQRIQSIKSEGEETENKS